MIQHAFSKFKHGKLDIKRYQHGILFVSFTSWVTLQTSDFYVICRVSCPFNLSDDISQKVQPHDDLIKGYAARYRQCFSDQLLAMQFI